MRKGCTTKCRMILTQDNEYSVVLDACVLVPMPLCDTLLRLAEEPAIYRPLWSDQILREVGDALERKLNRTPLQRDRRIRERGKAFPEARIEIPPDMSDGITCIPDPKDRHVVAAAICGSAQAIVTANTKHFPKACTSQYGLVCQHPDEFLIHQFHLNPELVLQKIDLQAAAYNRDRAAVLQSLRTVVPSFVALAELGIFGTGEEQSTKDDNEGN